jgi:hypothetical protein
MAAKPAAGPLTPTDDLLIDPTTTPPTIPAIRPEKSGAPLASAIPKHSGNATKNTTILEGRSDLKFLNGFELFIILICNYRAILICIALILI